MLRNFVANPNLEVRRRIIPMLRLDPEAYPEGLRALLPVVAEAARVHPGEYIRHRVEVLVGCGVPFHGHPGSGSEVAPNNAMQSDTQPRRANMVALSCSSLAAWLRAADGGR
jgi:hypothetical protein